MSAARASVRPRRAAVPAERALLEEALRPVQEGLEAVSQRMLSLLTDPVARKVVYLVTGGGKRLRPALVLLTGASGPSPRREALIDTATAVELIHTATLIHDDIIDESQLRRSQPAFHERWGTERAVLMGDYLYATAFALLSQLDEPRVMRVMSEVCQQLCRGELREVEARFRFDLTEGEYFDIIRDKTASLVSGCCRSGALLGGHTPEATERLAAFGMQFGLAFQIIDDCLDLTGDPRQLGKSILADLDKGALSLPMIYLARTLSASERTRLFAPLRRHATTPTALRHIAKAAHAHGTIARAQARAATLIDGALEALADTPMNGAATAYRQLAQYAVTRRS